MPSPPAQVHPQARGVSPAQNQGRLSICADSTIVHPQDAALAQFAEDGDREGTFVGGSSK